MTREEMEVKWPKWDISPELRGECQCSANASRSLGGHLVFLEMSDDFDTLDEAYDALNAVLEALGKDGE